MKLAKTTINYYGKTYTTTSTQLKKTPLKSAIHPNWFYTVDAIDNTNKSYIIWLCIPDGNTVKTNGINETVAFIREAK